MSVSLRATGCWQVEDFRRRGKVVPARGEGRRVRGSVRVKDPDPKPEIGESLQRGLVEFGFTRNGGSLKTSETPTS